MSIDERRAHGSPAHARAAGLALVPEDRKRQGLVITNALDRNHEQTKPDTVDTDDLVARADAAKIPVPKLRTAYTHLKAYEKQRAG